MDNVNALPKHHKIPFYYFCAPALITVWFKRLSHSCGSSLPAGKESWRSLGAHKSAPPALPQPLTSYQAEEDESTDLLLWVGATVRCVHIQGSLYCQDRTTLCRTLPGMAEPLLGPIPCLPCFPLPYQSAMGASAQWITCSLILMSVSAAREPEPRQSLIPFLEGGREGKERRGVQWEKTETRSLWLKLRWIRRHKF